MMTDDSQLFLSPAGQKFVAAVKADADARPWFDLGEEMAVFGLEILQEIEIPSHGRTVAAAGFFARVHESVQAAIILAQRGIIVDARSILRTAVECAIALHALAGDPTFNQRIAQASHSNALKVANMLLSNPTLRAGCSAEQIAKCEQQRSAILAMPKEERRPINWEEVANAHCRDLYDILYRFFSVDGVHVNTATLSRRYERVGDELTLMKVGPDPQGLVGVLRSSCEIFLHSAKPFLQIYPSADHSLRIEELKTKFEQMPFSELRW